MSLSASGSLRRGFASLRANWGLVWLRWLVSLVLWVLTVGSFVLPMVALGFEPAYALRLLLDGSMPPVDQIQQALERVSPALIGALIGALAFWTLGFFVYCWWLAGSYGVLIAAERQAGAGTRDRRLFKTFSPRNFAGWAGRYMWRYFWLLNLFAFFATPLLVLTLVWLLLLGFGGERWGLSAALGIGCGGALPLAFFAVVLLLGMWLATADAAREGSGPWTATRNGLRVLGRRLGATSLLALLIVFLLGCELAAVLVQSLVLESMTPNESWERMLLAVAFQAVFWLAAAVVGVLFNAAAVALVQSEVRSESMAPVRSEAA